MPVPASEGAPLSKIIEAEPTLVEWNTADETKYLLSLMSETNLAKVEAAQHGSRRADAQRELPQLLGARAGAVYPRARQ